MTRHAGTVTFHGLPCKRCGKTERYKTSGGCIACSTTMARRTQNAWRERTEHRYKKYGITKAHFDAILESQRRECVGCSAPLSGGKDTSIDHCHRTGVVRGLLCHNCNRALGMVKDSVEILLRLGVYLEKSHGKS